MNQQIEKIYSLCGPWVEGPKHLRHHLFSQSHQVGAGSEVEQPEFDLALTRDANTASNSTTRFPAALTLKEMFKQPTGKL